MPPDIFTYPGFSAIPDIPLYYSTVRGFAFVVDLILLCILFAELMKISAARARLKGKFGVILGVILGASATFALHTAGYNLLQHPLTGFIVAITVGTVTYRMMKPYWGFWPAMALAFFLGMGVLAVTAAAFSRQLSGWFALLMLIFFIVVLLTTILHFRGAGAARGGIAGGAAPPAPLGAPGRRRGWNPANWPGVRRIFGRAPQQHVRRLLQHAQNIIALAQQLQNQAQAAQAAGNAQQAQQLNALAAQLINRANAIIARAQAI
jgi:hypothetical protein